LSSVPPFSVIAPSAFRLPFWLRKALKLASSACSVANWPRGYQHRPFEGERAAAGEEPCWLLSAPLRIASALCEYSEPDWLLSAVGERQRGPVGDDNPCWLSSPAALSVCVLAASIRPWRLLTACALRMSPLPVAAEISPRYC
jgi:hypothetical protein